MEATKDEEELLLDLLQKQSRGITGSDSEDDGESNPSVNDNAGDDVIEVLEESEPSTARYFPRYTLFPLFPIFPPAPFFLPFQRSFNIQRSFTTEVTVMLPRFPLTAFSDPL